MRIGRKLTGILGAAVIAMAITTTLASTAMADTGFGSIQARNSGKCLDVRSQDNFFSAGARVQQWDCSGVAEQQWQFRSYAQILMPGGVGNTVTVYQIQSERSGLCMQVDAGGIHALVRQNTCGTGDPGSIAHQLFISLPSQGYHILKPLSNPSLCLDVQNGSNSNGNLLQQYSCTGGANQQFFGFPVLSS
jgi:arabinan endo-1,5-alpha-L-arabinosidase